MSRHINVNPGQYKVKGRQRQGDDIVPLEFKANLDKMRQKQVTKRKNARKR